MQFFRYLKGKKKVSTTGFCCTHSQCTEGFNDFKNLKIEMQWMTYTNIVRGPKNSARRVQYAWAALWYKSDLNLRQLTSQRLGIKPWRKPSSMLFLPLGFSWPRALAQKNSRELVSCRFTCLCSILFDVLSVSIFQMVKFPNDPCDVKGTKNGTCYTT